MDNSEIIIYIIVISIVFISALAKKRVVNPTEQEKTTEGRGSRDATNKSVKRETPLAQRYEWSDNYKKTKTIEEDDSFRSEERPKIDIPLNSAEELRKAVIVSEILKRKF